MKTENEMLIFSLTFPPSRTYSRSTPSRISAYSIFDVSLFSVISFWSCVASPLSGAVFVTAPAVFFAAPTSDIVILRFPSCRVNIDSLPSVLIVLPQVFSVLVSWSVSFFPFPFCILFYFFRPVRGFTCSSQGLRYKLKAPALPITQLPELFHIFLCSHSYVQMAQRKNWHHSAIYAIYSVYNPLLFSVSFHSPYRRFRLNPW